MSNYAFKLLLILTAIGTLVDGMASGLILLSMIETNNVLTQIIVFAGGIIITGIAMTTKVVFSAGAPKLLRYIWAVSVFIDLYSTIVGTISYVVLRMPMGTAVDFSLIQLYFSNVVPSALALGLTFIITGSSVTSLYVMENAYS